MNHKPHFEPDPLAPETAPAAGGSMPQPAAAFGSLPNTSEGFRKVPQSSAPFATLPQGSESFRTVPPSAESLPPPDWRESYTLTVRETVRLFETAGVARSERSIVNWCQQNRQGIARLDAYFDPNERRYFITRQSAETIIAEEKARAAKHTTESVTLAPEGSGIPAKPDAKTFRKVPNPAESTPSESKTDAHELAELRKENVDLKITNRGKDYYIDQLQKEREGLLRQVVEASHRVGQLETKLLQLRRAEEGERSSERDRERIATL